MTWWIVLAFGGGLTVGAGAAGWWLGDTSARLIAYLAIKHQFPLPTPDELRIAGRLQSGIVSEEHCENCCFVPHLDGTPDWVSTADCVEGECPNLPVREEVPA